MSKLQELQEREAKCRILAEWVGFRFEADAVVPQWHHPACRCAAVEAEDHCACHEGCYWYDSDPPDFYKSEEASALLFEHLASYERFCCVEVAKDNEGGVWHCSLRIASDDPAHAHIPLQPNYAWPDRKTAVAEAVLRHVIGAAVGESE